MKPLSIALLAALFLPFAFPAFNDHHDRVKASEIGAEIAEFRKQRDDFFKNHPRSPLKRQDKIKFDHLSYYPIDPKYRFKGKVERYLLDVRDPKYYAVFLTNKGTQKRYVRYGQFRFTVNGRGHTLQLYKSILSDAIFIPFKDATNGKETYSAGRYLDAEIVFPGYEITVDFNMAYNPSCTYNGVYACPIPPEENTLKIEIPAGEKKFPMNSPHPSPLPLGERAG